MGSPSSGDVTELLQQLSSGGDEIRDRLMGLVYDELHQIAERRMRSERPNHTLQPTALVNEAYLKLVDQKKSSWQNRSQFLAIAARKMRQILVDHARARHSKKRNSSARITLEVADLPGPQEAVDLLDLHEALEGLAEMDPRKAKVVEYKYFGGMTREEIAEALGVGVTTVSTDFRMAKAWLKSELAGQKQKP